MRNDMRNAGARGRRLHGPIGAIWLGLILLIALGPRGGIDRVQAQDQPALPAPTEDRVGYPEGYPDAYTLLFTFDRPDNGTVRYVYGNDAAASVGPGEAYPYGSILVMDVYRAERDASEAIVVDENGRFVRGELVGHFIQRKERGFGEAYGENRSGEWEYVAYRPDQSAMIPPENTGNCAKCHNEQAGASRDYVFRSELQFASASGAVPTAVISHYAFVPGVVTVGQGETVTWYNDDEAFHTVTGDAFDSGTLAIGASYSVTFDEAGEFPFACTIHPAMTGTVVVEPAE